MLFKDENENEEGDDDSLQQSSTMETDPVDYPDLLQVSMSSTTNAGTSGSTSGKGRKHPFLQRSDSTLCLGCPPLDPFDTPMCEALPLADQPHLLQPHSRREDLFGVPRQPAGSGNSGQQILETQPSRLGLSTRNSEGQINSSLILGNAAEQVTKTQGASTSQDLNNRQNQAQSEVGFSKTVVRKLICSS